MNSGGRWFIAVFFALVLALSLPFWIAGILYPVSILPGLPLSSLGAFTPAIAALILTAITGRAPALRRLLARSVDISKPPLWVWALALISLPVLTALAAAIHDDAQSWTLNVGSIAMIAAFLMAAWGEELGWSGYATDPLATRLGWRGAALVLGLFWAAWHVVPLLQAGRDVAWIAWWALGTIALRGILVWLYARGKQAVSVTILFHASINFCWQAGPGGGALYQPAALSLLATALAVLLWAGLPPSAAHRK